MEAEKPGMSEQELYELEQCEHEKTEDQYYERYDEVRLERQREKSERLERMEDELLGGEIGERLDRLEALLQGNSNAFIAQQEDIDLLARAYLEKAVRLLCHHFFTGEPGCYDEGSRALTRFETVAKYLNRGKRQALIDALDERRAKSSGDEWQAFKATLDELWSIPADRAAILRVSDSMPDSLKNLRIGYTFYEVLQKARIRDCLGEPNDEIGDL